MPVKGLQEHLKTLFRDLRRPSRGLWIAFMLWDLQGPARKHFRKHTFSCFLRRKPLQGLADLQNTDNRSSKPHKRRKEILNANKTCLIGDCAVIIQIPLQIWTFHLFSLSLYVNMMDWWHIHVEVPLWFQDQTMTLTRWRDPKLAYKDFQGLFMAPKRAVWFSPPSHPSHPEA